MNANHIYRIIWSEIHEAWVAVSEITRTHGKRKAVRLALPLALLSANALADGTPTTVVPTGGKTNAYFSANGVPVVNINSANAAGLSHNQYTRYDVERKGLVLNNGNASQIQRASQLAGSVLANPNLNQEARVILNEVVSTNRSMLSGFTEVVGGRADVVVANPNGITCSGCGFINTDRATLTTGTPQINASGSLTGFSVNRGDLLIEGDGLNASGQQILDLVARSIKVDAPVNVGGSLQLVTGPNVWSYDTRGVTGTVAGSGPAPSYAIDSSSLGGMYAGRIRLIATEAGIGVKMLGEAAASADDFSLNSAGNVLINAHFSAKRDLTVTASDNGSDITLSSADARLTAGRALSVSTETGSIDNQGLLLSGGTLTVSAGQSINNGASAAMSAPLGDLFLTAENGDITNAGWLYSGTKVKAESVQGTFTNRNITNGGVWSGGDVEITADTVVNNNSIDALNDISITSTTSFRNEIKGGMPAKTNSEAVTTDDHQIAHIDAWDHTTCWPHWACSYINVREDTVTVTEAWAGGSPNVAGIPQPQIVAGRNLTIALNDGTGVNIGGVLSAAQNLSIRGSGASSFTNTAVGLYARDYKRRWAEDNDDCFDCNEHFYYTYANSEYYFDNLPHWGFADFVSWWPSAGTSVHEFDATLYQLARNSAYRHLDSTALVGGSTLRAAVIRGGTVDIDVGRLNNLELPVANPGTVPSPPALPPPTNPNGYFVPAKDASANYVFELNPLYGLGSDYVGSDHLLKSLGIDPDGTVKRLGDANYEAYLIRQQLVSQTGSALLNGSVNQAAQMTRLLDQAVGESKRLGLTIGKAPTAEQIAGLKQDIVWMIETEVNGRKVLTPVVYLAAESRQSIASGAVIAGKDVNIKVTSLTNTGGTISGSHSLSISAEGDIDNVSGTLRGGDVSLKSSTGNISIRRSEDLGSGTAYSAARVDASGDLEIETAKDIQVRGAELKAGDSASLTASGKITVDTVVDKTSLASATAGSANFLYQTGPTNTFTVTERNTASTITTGGNLTLKSGGDTTLAGTRTSVGGDLDVDAGGDFNILSRQDKTTTHSESTTTGVGVGGGLWGTEKTTVDDFTGKNFGSSITVGGNADIDAAGDMTLRGSSVDIAKSATIDTRSVTIEQGLDEKHTVTRTDTTTFLSTDSNKNSGATAGVSAESGNAAASANASASAGAGENSEFNLMEKRTTTVDHTKTTGVASRLTTGDDLTITTSDSVTVQGSNVEAGKALKVDARRIEILAGENNEKTTTTTDTTKIGIYTDSKAEAKSEAGASATGMSASAKAGASVDASADSTVTLGTRFESSTDETTSLTHSSSSLKSGGMMTLKAADEAKFVGAKIQSGGDLNIEARDITNLAAEDKTTTTSDKTTRTAGIYLEGNASAEAQGSVNAGPGNVSATGGVSAGAEGSAGLHYSQNAEGSEQGATRNVVNTFESGGNIVRKAAGTITDQGTQLDARQDITQSATTLKEIAAEDKTWSSSTSEKHDAKIGVYAGAGFSGDAGAQTSVVSTGKYAEDLGPEASAGLQAKYSYDKASEGRSDATAVTSRYKAGGSISSTTTEKTTLIGTQFEAGKDVTLGAASLDYQAARDTSSTSSESYSGSAEAKAKLTGTVGAEASGSYEQGKSSSIASTARAGGISAGGNVTVTTQDDARFEGTSIDSGGKAKIESKAGSVTFDAAKSTTHEESSGFNVSAGFGSTNQPGKDAGKGAANERETKTTLGGGYSTSKGHSATEAGATINAREVEVSAGKDATLHGTQVNATEKASVTAQGDVKLLEATNSSSGSSFGISGNATGMSMTKPDGDNSKAQYGSGNVNVAHQERKTGTATSIRSGGDLTVKGTNIISQQANYSAGGNLATEGAVKTQNLTSVNKGMKVDANMSFVHRSTNKAKAKDNKPGAKAPSKSDPTKTASKTKNKLRRNNQPPAPNGGQTSSVK